MKIQYENKNEDFIMFALQHHNNSPSVRKQLLILKILLTLFVLFIPSLIAYYEKSMLLFIIGFVIAITYYLTYKNQTQLSLIKLLHKIFGEGSNESILGLRTLEITPDALVEVGEFIESRISWSVVSKMIQTPNYFYVYISATNALVIPHKRILEGDYNEFQRQLKKYSGIRI